MTIEALKAELTNDPEGIGYAGMTDQQAYDALLSPTRTTWLDLAREQLVEALDPAELHAKSVQEISLLNFLLQGDSVKSTPGSTAREVIELIFPAGAGGVNTRTKLVAAARVDNVTRASQIGIEDYVTLDRVIRARA